jgi:hypothetical protein
MDLVDLLTHDPDATETAYLSGGAAHPLALLTERTDLLDKLSGDHSDVTADVAAQIRRRPWSAWPHSTDWPHAPQFPPHRG